MLGRVVGFLALVERAHHLAVVVDDGVDVGGRLVRRIVELHDLGGAGSQGTLGLDGAEVAEDLLVERDVDARANAEAAEVGDGDGHVEVRAVDVVVVEVVDLQVRGAVSLGALGVATVAVVRVDRRELPVVGLGERDLAERADVRDVVNTGS
jgi:hypothetical protein